MQQTLSCIYNAQLLYCRQVVVVRSRLSPLNPMKMLVQASSSIPPVRLLSPLNPMKMLVQVNPDQPPCLSAAYNLVILTGLIFVKLKLQKLNLNNKTSIYNFSFVKTNSGHIQVMNAFWAKFCSIHWLREVHGI